MVVPARDEEEQIGGCLAALLDQRGLADLRVVVVDDGSTDGTAEVVRSFDRPAGPAPRRRAAPGGLAGQAARLRRRVRRRPPATRPTTRSWCSSTPTSGSSPTPSPVRSPLLERHGLDLVSPWPRPLAVGPAERLVQPLAPWLWATTLPLRLAERSPRPSLAAANGQFLVLTRTGYDRAGGHAAVRGEVLEDIALLRAVKRSGGRGVPVDGSRLAACRMYDGWPARARRLRQVALVGRRRAPGGRAPPPRPR